VFVEVRRTAECSQLRTYVTARLMSKGCNGLREEQDTCRSYEAPISFHL